MALGPQLLSRTGKRLAKHHREKTRTEPATLGRHIQLLEAQCQQQLFRRSNQGLSPTEAATSLRATAEQMQRGADSMLRQSAGREETLSGTVRLSANEIVVTNATSSLSKREADMALRMYRPTDPALLSVKVANMPLGFYAGETYISSRGTPQNAAELTLHTLIGFDQDDVFIEAARAQDWALTPQDFDYRCDNLLMGIALMKAGAGIQVTHCGLAEKTDNVRRVCPDIELPELSLWIASHRDLRNSAPMAAFSHFLQIWLKGDPYTGMTNL